jgi:hypothetical protein
LVLRAERVLPVRETGADAVITAAETTDDGDEEELTR